MLDEGEWTALHSGHFISGDRAWEAEPQNWSEHSARKEETTVTLPETETFLWIIDYAELPRRTEASTWHKTFVLNLFHHGPCTYFGRHNRNYSTSLCNVISTFFIAFYRMYGYVRYICYITIEINVYICLRSFIEVVARLIVFIVLQ
jgi:hypothetical protein